MGIEIQLIQGNKENIKITTPEDLKKAQVYINLISE
jgi:2-C-methyl-D-erythritol 4-phosphate cytidylyltransferase